MTVTYGPRFAFTSDGDNQGIVGGGFVYKQLNTPSDAYLLPDPPGAYNDYDTGAARYRWHHDEKEWRIIPDCWPSTAPSDLWAWDYSLRYDVEPNDPLRESWVLKPDAEPVEQPQAD